MVRYCSNCGVEGNFLEIRDRSLPLSYAQNLCKNCYKKFYQEESQQLQIINNRKEKILRKMYEGVLKKFCREKAIPTSEQKWSIATSRRGTRYRRYYTYYYTYDELVGFLLLDSSLDEIIEFAQRNNVPIREIMTEIENEKTQHEFQNVKYDNAILQQIIGEIIDFKPILNDYNFELPYHIDLARFLMNKYPNAQVEIQKSSARPDIVINNIAIEIKGPTTEKGLQTIADKCIRYPQHFDKNLIIVLFDLKVTNRFYNDWETGIKQNFPNVTIINK